MPNKPDDRGAEGRPHSDVGTGDDVSHQSSLAIGRVGERRQQRLAPKRIALGHGISDGIDMRLARLLSVIHDDRSALAQFETGSRRQQRLGLDTNRQCHQVGRNRAAIGQRHLVVTDADDLRAEVDGDAMGVEIVLDQHGQLRIKRRHHLVGGFDQVDREPRWCRFSANSSPMKPAPMTTADCGFDSRAVVIASASDSSRRMSARSTPSSGGITR